jgi:two-component system, NarL family, response regulator LiaR
MSQPSTIRLLLVDDQAAVHEAVALVLNAVDDIVIVGQCRSGQEALELCPQLHPDLILMDVVMPGMSGFEATRLIHQQHPEIKILVLSSFQDDESVRNMLANGAIGYVLKGALASDLVDTIRTVHSGKSVFSAEIAQALLQPSPDDTRENFGLTRRELEVLRLLAEGLSHKEIGARLVISASTVKFHIVNILKKMGVETRSEAVVLAAKNHFI